jgi:hypothetical protein
MTTLNAIATIRVACAQLPAPVIIDLPPRYFCRSHLDEPVTWRGNGCVACQSEAKSHRARALALKAEVAS